MKKFISTIIASTALLVAPIAGAQTWTPSGTSPWQWDGRALVQKGGGPILNCTFHVEIDVPAGGVGSTTTGRFTVGPPEPLCATIFVQSGPNHVVDYAIDAGGNETFTFRDVYVNTTITMGDCAGDVTITFNDNSPPSLGDNSLDADPAVAVLPPVVAGTGSCTINGNLPNSVPAPADADIT